MKYFFYLAISFICSSTLISSVAVADFGYGIGYGIQPNGQFGYGYTYGDHENDPSSPLYHQQYNQEQERNRQQEESDNNLRRLRDENDQLKQEADRAATYSSTPARVNTSGPVYLAISGRCYGFHSSGNSMAGGAELIFTKCSKSKPSTVTWQKSKNGEAKCYQVALNKKGQATDQILNDGYPVADSICQTILPSRFIMHLAKDGQQACFEISESGLVLNHYIAVNKNLCSKNTEAKSYWTRGTMNRQFHGGKIKLQYEGCFKISSTGTFPNGGFAPMALCSGMETSIRPQARFINIPESSSIYQGQIVWDQFSPAKCIYINSQTGNILYDESPAPIEECADKRPR